MPSTRVRLTLAGAWLLLAGTPLLAQQPAPGDRPPAGGPGARPHMPAMSMPDCPMHAAMMRGPAAALRAGATLELSAEQRTRLQNVQRQVDAAAASAMQGMRALHTRLDTLSRRPQLDESAARAAFDAMGRLHTQMGMTMLRASYDVAAILTPAQRDSLAAITRRQMPPPGAMPMRGMPMGDAMPMMCPMPGPSAMPHG
jgi:Spy/CpxP family protein refolding chaperone